MVIVNKVIKHGIPCLTPEPKRIPYMGNNFRCCMYRAQWWKIIHFVDMQLFDWEMKWIGPICSPKKFARKINIMHVVGWIKVEHVLSIFVSNFISWCNRILTFVTTNSYVFWSIEEISLSCNAWVPHWVGCRLDNKSIKFWHWMLVGGEFWFLSTSLIRMGNFTIFN
jgi:hypothetical protein